MPSNWSRMAALILLLGLATAWAPGPAAQTAFCLAGSGLAVCWLAAMVCSRRPIVLTGAWAILAGLILWMAAQRLLAPSPAPMAAAREAGTWACATLMGLLLMNETDCPRRLSHPLRALVLVSGLLSLWALFQGLTSHGRILWLFDPQPPVERAWGPFLYHNKLAQFAETVLPAALCMAATDAARRWWWLVTAAGLLAVSVAAASRAGVALLGAELVICTLLLRVRRLISWRQAGLLAGQLVLAAGIAVVVIGWESLERRLDLQQMMHDRRFDLNCSSMAMARAHLPWGAGYGAWPIVYPEYATFDDGRFANQAHNDWLQWLCEGGVPGAALMALFVAAIALPLLRGVWGCGVLFVFVHAGVDYPFHQSAPLVALIAAVALAAHRDNGRWISHHAAPARNLIDAQYAPSPVSTTFTVLPRM
jgi:O-antigen ligase